VSNILTDILGLNSQKKYKENPLAAKDVFVIGDVDVPRMVGISSPIPIKDEKLVTFYDLALSVIGLLQIENVGPGAELVIPPAQTGNPFLWNVRTLTSLDGTVSIVEGGDTLDFAAIFSTDVHPIDFTYNQTTHELTIEQNSAPGPIQFLTVDLDNLALEILDEGVSIDTNVTQIDFVGEGVAASLDGGNIVVEVNQPALQIQEEGGLVPPGGSTALTTINFIGDAITATTGAAGAVNVTVNSPVTIEDEGSVINTAPLTIIDFVGDGVTTTETSAGEIEVSIPQGQFDIEEEGVVISTAAITSIDFVGDGVTASETAPGEIQVEVANQEEVFLLMSSNCYFSSSRTEGIAYITSPPTSGAYRFGGPSPGFGSGLSIFTPDAAGWNPSTSIGNADVVLGVNPQTFVAKEDQITQAIPIPVDLLATDKIKVSGTCYINQSFGSPKIKVAVGMGECDDDRSFNILNDTSVDTFTGALEDAANTRRGAYYRICFEFDTLIGGDGAQAGNDHFFMGFSFENLNLPLSGDFTEIITVNWNMSAIKNPS